MTHPNFIVCLEKMLTQFMIATDPMQYVKNPLIFVKTNRIYWNSKRMDFFLTRKKYSLTAVLVW